MVSPFQPLKFAAIRLFGKLVHREPVRWPGQCDNAVADFIKRDNPIRAETFITELTAKFATICERPLSYPARNEIYPGLRSALHGKYLILFLAMEDEVDIARVVHGARDLEELL